MSGFAPRVKAVLGPTNTGKTHLAIDRLLGHASGIIGFPLRLLARENYDRMVAIKGVRHVALITGEEKIVPPEARWFSCTVEAMPLDRQVEFIAVDEIQLCADADRGHVFTDRLLHARGMVETMFLGAETIRKLLKRLVPEAEIETRPRLSQLTFTGATKLSRLPPRSAIVAFSAAEVYAIAEAVRSRRGGCAVVMGRLSPRTRNAQVALYQDKEVDFLVATDAIGMGLNMDVDHVAFAGLSKFDGHRPRPLTAAEIAQIAGRAGRGMRDGTFGTTGPCRPLTEELVAAVEAHAFEPLEQLAWRNSSLDFTSIETLLASLLSSPERQGLTRGHDASDLLTLIGLSGDAAIRARARSPRAVRMLWDACQIPDFRKLATDAHSKLCARVFQHLLDDGVLPEDWVAAQIAVLGRTDGDIDTLMQRLADVRIWAYIAARADWVRHALVWQGRAREAEDLLSDALHEKLMARFVDRRAARITRSLDAGEPAGLMSAVTSSGEVVVEGHTVGRIDGFRFEPDASIGGSDKRLVLRAARRALGGEMPRRVALVQAAPDAAFALQPDGAITWLGAPIARLRQGSALLAPAIEIIDSEFLDGTQRETLRARLARTIETIIAHELTPLFAAADAALSRPELRGIVHRLTEQAGILPAATIDAALRPELRRIGIRAGCFAIYLPAMLKPRPARLRATLWAAWRKRWLPPLPAPGLISMTSPDWPDGLATFMGWLECGPRAIRLDIAERIAADLRYTARRRPVPVPAGLASRLGISQDDLGPVLNGLGLRLLAAEILDDAVFGPPQPARIAIAAQRKPAAAPPDQPVRTPNPDHPFAVLASYRREAS
ncbi:helicase-related protein [Acidiphilium sp.]|uniref:helicase-related protein n=1 Tax=Acidiphilium sp. TaxID=527 RepID=UPI003D06C81C